MERGYAATQRLVRHASTYDECVRDDLYSTSFPKLSIFLFLIPYCVSNGSDGQLLSGGTKKRQPYPGESKL